MRANLFIRAGKLIGREYFILEGTAETADGEIIAQFVKQFYSGLPPSPAGVVADLKWKKCRSFPSG